MILLYSGLDSYLAWHYLGKPQTIYFKLGHRYQDQEIKCINDTIPGTIIEDCLKLGKWEHPDAFIPLRNDLLIRLASLYDDEIVLVVQKGELELEDRSPKFLNDIQESLSYLHKKPIKVWSPFMDMTKQQMVKWYVEQGLPVEDLLKTRSCYAPTEIPCGECPACFRRWVAFAYSGIEEPMANDITKWSGLQSYIDKLKNGKYEVTRTDETLEVLQRKGLI